MADFRRWLLALAVLSLLSATAHAQLFGSAVIDAPQHAYVAGVGVGPTSKDFQVVGGFAEKIASPGTYSYTSVSIVPHVIKQGSISTLSITPITATGLKQIVFQHDRLTLAIDGSAGVTLPTVASGAFNFSAIGAVDVLWRLSRTLDSKPGGGNNYIAFAPQFTQIAGTQGGTVISLGVAFVHSSNGQAAAAP